jgi:hypothetical protein
MHPELQRLEQQYMNLVAELQAGHILEEDALRVLAGFTAIDGEGAVWSIDPFTGEFVRAFPNSTPTPTDPSAFAPSQLPVVPVRVPPHGTSPDQVSPYLHPSLHPSPPAPMTERAASVLGAGAAGTAKVLGPVGGFLRRHLRTILVPLGVLALALVLISRSPATNSVGEPSTGETLAPVVTAPPPTIVIPGAPVTETTPTPPVVTAPPAPVVPDGAALDALLAVLVSGDQVALDAVLPQEQDVRLALVGVLGAPRAGLTLSWGEVRKSTNSVIVPVRFGDPAKPSRVVKLRLQYRDVRWVIVATVK